MHASSHEEMDIRASAIFAARNLGYEKLKDLQMDVLLTTHSPSITWVFDIAFYGTSTLTPLL